MSSKLLVDPAVLAFAVRYSIGRKTYAPSLVIDNVKSNINSISDSMIDVILLNSLKSKTHADFNSAWVFDFT